MKVFNFIAAACVVAIGTGGTAAAQQLIERYTAVIAPQDRQNSGGAALTQPAAILAQDRANFHRFGVRQPGDSADRTFSVQQNRAAFGGLLGRGRMGPGVADAIVRGANPTVVVEVYGAGSVAQYVTVALQSPGQQTAAASAATVPQQSQGTVLPVLPVPSSAPGGWAFSNDTHAWRGNASVKRGADEIVTLGCTRPGAIPAQYPGGGHVRPHEPGVLNLLIEPEAIGVNLSGGAQNYAVTVTVDGQALGTAPVILLSPEMKLATNVPLNHPIVEALKSGGTLQLSEGTTGGSLQTSLAGARAALDALKTFCAQPLQAAPAAVAALPGTASTPAPAAASNPAPAPAAAPGVLSATAGLLFLDSRPIVLAGAARPEALTGSDAANEHENILSRKLYFSALMASTDNLEASLAAAQSHNQLRPFFDFLPLDAKTRIRDFGLSIMNDPSMQQYCATAPERQMWSCMSGRSMTEFDSRRLAQKVAQEVAAVARAEAIKTPLNIQIFCGVTGIDRAYDFSAQTVNWGSFIQNGTCGNPNLPLNHMLRNVGQTAFDYRLGEALPEASPMPPAQVEALAQQSTSRPADRIFRPLLLGFQGQITLERDGAQQRQSQLGLEPVKVVFSRTGPIDLRWSGQPTRVVLQFEGMSDSQRPSDAPLLMSAETIAGLLDGVAPLEAPSVAEAFAAFIEGEAAGETVQVKLPAYLNEREALPRLEITSLTLGRQGLALATATEVPRDSLAWNQVQSRTRGIPDTEVFMAFDRPWESVTSDPVDPSIGRQNQVSIVAELSGRSITQGEVGPSMFAFVKPLYFEVTGRGVAGATKVVARVPLSAPPEREERVRIFVPTARWYLHQSVTKAGLDLEEQLNSALEQTGIYGNDVFARLDAAETEAQKLADFAERNEGREPWVFGSVRLGPFDLQQEGYPIASLQVTIPAQDQIDQRLTRAWTPQIDVRSVLLPIPTDKAREMRETLKPDTNYPIRARIAITSTGVPGQSPAVAELQEISLLQPQRGSRQPVLESAFTPGDEVITFDLKGAQ